MNGNDVRELPGSFDVSVVLDVGPGRGVGEVVGVVAGGLDRDAAPRTLRSSEGDERILLPGFRLSLHRDEAESYYLNLKGERPAVFVVCGEGEEGRIRPTLVTLSYDEASAYMEVEDAVFSVPMPPELYRWVEAFVLRHYVPQRREKRKLDRWKEGSQQ